MLHLSESRCNLTNKGLMLFHEVMSLEEMKVRNGQILITGDAKYTYTDVTNAHVFEGTHTTASRTIYEDGVSKNTNSTSGAFIAQDRYRIGSLFQDQFYWDGLIAEVIVYNRLLSDTERALVRRYLGNRYGIIVS